MSKIKVQSNVLINDEYSLIWRFNLKSGVAVVETPSCHHGTRDHAPAIQSCARQQDASQVIRGNKLFVSHVNKINELHEKTSTDILR